MSWQDRWRVVVGGDDISVELSEHLNSISVTDKDGATADSLSITLDDTGGQHRLPKEGERVRVWFDGVEVFSGRLDAPKSKGSVSSGRTLSVTAKSVANAERAKEPLTMFGDDQTLGEFMGAMAQEAGFELVIDDELSEVFDDYWSADAQSYQAFGENIARELNATFKFKDDVSVLAKRGKGLAPNGKQLPTVVAQWGDNLISWDIVPRQPRPLHKKTEVRYFDRQAGEVKSEVVEHEGVDNKVNQMIKTLAPNKSTAKRVAQARGGEQARAKGGGSVEILPDPTATVEGTLKIAGARKGIDGSYRITQVRLSGGIGGNSQTLEVKEPSGNAGVDDR
jgi:phage protein D